MRKQDLIIIAVLFALLMAWPFVYKQWIEPRVAPPAAAAPNLAAVSNVADLSAKADAAAPAVGPAGKTLPDAAAPLFETEKSVTAPILAAGPEQEPAALLPGELVTITNAGTAIAISTLNGGVVSATFSDYRASVSKTSGPVVLNFAKAPSLAYREMKGFPAISNFALIAGGPTNVVLECAFPNGLRLTRSIQLNEKHQLIVDDFFTNTGAAAQTIPKHAVQVGPMRMPAGEYSMSGMDYLGIDVYASSGGEGVINWAGKLAALFNATNTSFFARIFSSNTTKKDETRLLPKTIAKDEDIPIDWLAVKNKFFVQILVPEGGAVGYTVMAGRDLARGEEKNPELAPKSAVIKNVAALAVMAEKTLNAGEALNQNFKLYLGPKKFSILRTLGLHQEDVMEFGMWSPVCKFLLLVLNLTYSAIPNYGVAVIILTILIRVIFWPLTHKGTESMKKMQALQPLMTELRAKYKDSPKKMQEETMALYRKHKVNPVSGCLPMLIQIPVFIALFIVLRSAIELRFAPFLWIQDLSSPERLFADILPIPLNILPIFMAVTQAWQQALMPAADANQQKMMLFFMPALMLVMFYMMPSALVLYWSANQCIVIVQQLITKKRSAAKAAAAAK